MMGAMIDPIRDLRELNGALGAPAAFIFKHSTRCPVSARAAGEVERFAARNPEVPVGRVLVIEDRTVSDEIASRLGVVHASPQTILVRGGSAVWSASHAGVDAGAMESAWAGIAMPRD